MFNPLFMPAVIYTVGYILPQVEKSKIPKELSDDEELLEAYLFKLNPYLLIAHYVFQVALVLIVTTFTKRLFARARPQVPQLSKRLIDLRSKETNCSFPSGDAC